ncbi:MAG: DUF3224 domain-containing protein [Dermatophilaceae bacterium]
MTITTCTFTVPSTEPLDYRPAITTALPTGIMHMVKEYAGDVTGTSVTEFVACFDPASGVGTYVAMESFEGVLAGRQGAFNFWHAASTDGADREHAYGVIVPASGTGELAGITGTVDLAIDPDGTHHFTFDHSL